MVVRKLLKTISRAWLVMMILVNITPVAHAQLNCEQLNDPEKTKDYVISIVEEQFGKETTSTDKDTQVLRCVRKTVCETKEKPKIGGKEGETVSENECKSQYVEKGNCTPETGKQVCQTVDVFIAKSGIDLLFLYLKTIYQWSASVIGIVTVFYLVYGGIKISTAGDNTAAIDEAKTKIAQSIGGLVLLFLSAIILYTINPNFFTL